MWMKEAAPAASENAARVASTPDRPRLSEEIAERPYFLVDHGRQFIGDAQSTATRREYRGSLRNSEEPKRSEHEISNLSIKCRSPSKNA
jgi:hypothetical protein